MLRGNKVGQAYVALTVDGDGINEEIADSFDGVDWKKHGDDHGRRYTKTLRDHLKSLDKDFNDLFDKIGRRASSRMARAFDTDRTLDNVANNVIDRAFNEGKMDDLVGRIGERAGYQFGTEMDKAVVHEIQSTLKKNLRKIAEDPDLNMHALLTARSGTTGDIQILGPAIKDATRKVEGLIKQSAKITREVEEAAYKEHARREKLRYEGDRQRWMEHFDWRESVEKAYTNYLAEQERERSRNAERESRLRIDQEAMGVRIVRRMHEENEKWWTRALDDDRFATSIKKAEAHIARLVKASKKPFRIDVKFNPKALAKLERELRDYYAKMDDLEVKLHGDLPLAERTRIKEEIESIQAKIKVRLDESGLHGRRAQAEAEQVSGNRRNRTNIGIFGLGRRSRMADTIGSLFGAGSRNNALNLLGKTIGNVLNQAAKLGRIGSTLGKTFTEAFTEANQTMGVFRSGLAGVQATGSKALAGIGEGFSAVVRSGPAAVGAIVVVAAALSALVSVVSALTALLVAMAATITSALVGALAVLGGTLAAAAGAAGLLAAAFLSMTDAQKKALGTAFKPLGNVLRGLGQIVMKDLVPAFDTWSKNLQRAVGMAAPVAQVMGKAFAEAGNALTASLSGPGFQRFADMMTVHLPGITTKMTAALGGFLNGFMGLFAALLPYVEQFAGYLERTAETFSKWANSAQGQSAIQDFVARALTSLRSLWNFTREFFGWLGDLLFSPQAQTAGNSIFDSLARSFAGFRDSLQSAMRDGSLKKWFDDAIKFGSDLKRVIIGLKDAWLALDNSGVLQGVGAALAVIGDTLRIVAKVIGPVVDAVGWLFEKVNPLYIILGPFGVALAGLVESFKALIGPIKAVVDWLGRGLDAIGGWLGSFYDAQPKTRKAMSDLVASAGDGVLDQQFMMTESGLVLGESLNAALGSKAPELYATGANLVGQVQAGIGSGVVIPVELRMTNKFGAKGDVPRHLGPIPKAKPNAEQQAAAAARKAAEALAKMLRESGADAASQTSKTPSASTSGGGTPNITERDEYNLPKKYREMAKRLIKEGPKVAAQIKNAALTMDKQVSKAIRDAVGSSSAESVQSSLRSMSQTVVTSAKQMVNTSQQALNSAAQRLANSTSKQETKKALQAIRRAKRDRKAAREQRAAAREVAQMLRSQEKITNSSVTKMGTALEKLDIAKATASNVAGLRGYLKSQNATLADFARTREILAGKIEEAGQRLADAIALRDNYKEQIAQSIRDYGSLLTAEAKTVDGVVQALTAGDIVGNLQDRLTEIKKFRDNLNMLLAMGVSESVYKTLLDAGVEGAGAYVEALIGGGAGAIQEVNDLIAQIDDVGLSVGGQAATRMYQAGVDAAQGLVDGLNSLSDELDTAATKLGNAIVEAVRRALQTRSPSKKAFAIMEDFGDGSVLGLDAQHGKVRRASDRLAAQIAPSPEVARWEMQQRGAVSGNGEGAATEHHWHIETPTTDPEAVAHEVLNEVTGRL